MPRFLRSPALWIALAVLPLPVAADVVITEFMAVNDSTFEDEDGSFPDWFEVYNCGPGSVDLGGWYATDDLADLTKWQFPTRVLGEGEFLLVFASEKDRRGDELHVSFRLSGGGESLALVEPDGVTIAWQFADYPLQVPDFSYGLSQNANFARLVRAGDPATALVPTGNIGTSWREVDFDDGGWMSGVTGVGYDRNSDYTNLIDIDLEDAMYDQREGCYIRVPFTVENAADFGGLTLRMKYDDGFVAYINGSKVAEANAPSSPAWNSTASSDHRDEEALVYESFSLSANVLEDGDNVLAIHGLNRSTGSSDFLIVPELDAVGGGELDATQQLYFHLPSPGFGNLPGFSGISTPPAFSVESGVFSTDFDLVLDAPGTIRYTTDGSEPEEGSTVYGGPISVGESVMVRARSFDGDLSPSPVVTHTYLRLSSTVRNFDSDIPIVVIDNFGAGSVPANSQQMAFMAIFEPKEDGRARLTRAPDVSTRIGIKIRGSSTQNRPKKAYTVEAWDERDNDKDILPLGLPEESDWILYGAYNFDRALLRNPFIYELSNRVGRYACRSKFCEVYVNTGGGSMSSSDYVGVYSFMEKIKRGPDRVDVERLSPTHDAPPEIQGGYMMKIDRLDPGDSGFSAAGRTIGYVYPKEDNITDDQATWLRNYMNAFNTTLNGANFRDPVNGYVRYVDVDSWIDHHILNVLPMNVDALRLSTYFYKSRFGRIEFGPIWDFDRSMGSTDGRDDNPRAWRGTGDATDYFNYPWWNRLFDDPDFWQRWRDRWQELRRGDLSQASIEGIIDSMADVISEAQVRNFQKWNVLGGRTWSSEVAWMKSWLRARAQWIDDQFPAAPEFSNSGHHINPGFQLRLTSEEGSIYYTIDGSDPRARGGSIASGAEQYSGPIVLDDNSRVVARTRVSASMWSGPVAETFVVTTPRLVVSEIMYHPEDPPLDSVYDDDDFEFLEFLNASDTPIDLAGASVATAIRFTFPDDAGELAPGEHIVIVSNLDAFAERYDAGAIRIGGEYDGNLDNDSEVISVYGPLVEPIMEFAYSDAWLPETDGFGVSLTFADPSEELNTWSEPANWIEATVLGGTPGDEDPALSGLGGRQRPGDSNQDGNVDIADAVSYLRRLFGGGAAALPCDGASLEDGGNLAVLDANADDSVDISDVLYILGYLFENGPPPPLGSGACVRIEGCPSACGF